MKITESITRECCERKDLKQAIAFNKKWMFCIHCGQLWEPDRVFNGVDYDDTLKRVQIDQGLCARREVVVADKTCQCKNCLKTLLVEPCSINVTMKLNVKFSVENAKLREALNQISDRCDTESEYVTYSIAREALDFKA